MAGVLDVGVLFTSTDGRERAAALPDDLRAARWPTHDLVDPTGRLRVERDRRRRRAGRRRPGAHARVAAGGADLARLVCVGADGPISADDVHALERAAAVAALLITREEAVAAVENKYQGDFLRDLFLRRAGDEQYVVEHADGVRLGPATGRSSWWPPRSTRTRSATSRSPASSGGSGRSGSPRPGGR